MNLLQKSITILICIISLNATTSCKKIEKVTTYQYRPEIFELGYKTSATIGYCASLASMAFNTEILPGNVVFYEDFPGRYYSSGTIYIEISDKYPLPINQEKGNIVISAVWDNEMKSGVMSILFKKTNNLTGINTYAMLETIPFIEENNTGKIITTFDQQDILSNKNTFNKLKISRSIFDFELSRAQLVASGSLNSNTCVVKINQQNTFPNLYDDTYETNFDNQITGIIDNS